MAKGAKYAGLTNYLKGCGQRIVTLSFQEIIRLGAELPQSAYKWPALWSNSSGGSLSYGWLLAGYFSQSVDLRQQTVEFVYDPKKANQCLGTSSVQDCGEPVAQMTTGQVKYEPALPLTPAQDIEYYIRHVKDYFGTMSEDEHSRYLSWEHCHAFFVKNRHAPDEETLDLLCLHLAWYLASWGMLRGGAFLLQKDYKVHMPVVRLLTSERIGHLYNLSIDALCRMDTIDEIMALSDEIVAAYRKKTRQDGLGKGKTASATLVTKILLGTLGCTPAYDRYFRQALIQSGIASGTFGRTSLLQLAKFYRANRGEFEACRKEMSSNGIEYTPMKVLDMCFWQIGFMGGKSWRYS